MEKQRIRAVIFDLDNTLYDYDAAAREAERAVTDYARTQLELSDEKMAEGLRRAQELLLSRVQTGASVHSRLLRYQFFLETVEKPLFPHARLLTETYWETFLRFAKPNPGALRTLEALKNQGARIGIGTNMTAYMQARKLETIGAAPYLDFLVTSEEAGAEKPLPPVFALCAEKAGVPPRNCLFVGDNPVHDYAGATGFGMQALLYCPGEKDLPRAEEERPQIPAKDVITDLREILERTACPDAD